MSDAPMSLSAEIAAAERAARSESAKIRGTLLATLRLTKAYRRVFLQPGKATAADQRLVLGDLIDRSELGRASLTLDAQELAAMEGQRRVVLHIFGRFRLPEGRIRQLETDLTETTDDEE